MNEEQLLDRACRIITQSIRFYIDRNDVYGFRDLEVDIRAEVRRAMQDARLEALRGN